MAIEMVAAAPLIGMSTSAAAACAWSAFDVDVDVGIIFSMS
jgi:hypothetical protein